MPPAATSASAARPPDRCRGFGLSIDPAGLGLRPFEETYDELGPVSGQVIDLGERWETALCSPGAAHQSLAEVEAVVPVPPAVAWDWLTDPARRVEWDGRSPMEESTVGGRRGIGTTSRCVVGRLSTLEEVVEWRPYERLARRARIGRLGQTTWTWELHPTVGGTRLRLRWTRPRPAAWRVTRPEGLVDELQESVGRLEHLLGGAGAH